MALNINDFIKLTKVGVADNPIYKTAANDEWVPGEYNIGIVPPVEYTIKGYISSPPQKDGRLVVVRVERNGIEANGIFRSSPILRVKEMDSKTLVYTENSIYCIEKEEKENVSP